MNETVIQPMGVLDRAMAESILNNLSGSMNPMIDGSGLDLVLPEGIFFLKEYFGPLIAIRNLKDSLSQECVRYGLPSSKGTIWLGKVSKTPEGLLCKACEKTIRATVEGHYACPHCGTHFYFDNRGKTVFYEALRKLF